MSLRKKNAMDRAQWGKKQSADSGIGSRAIKWIDPGELTEIRPAYDKVVSVVASFPENQQRAILLMAASGFTFESLVSKATTGGKLGARRLKDWYNTLPPTEQQRIMMEALSTHAPRKRIRSRK
jgi:hypothetical protein